MTVHVKVGQEYLHKSVYRARVEGGDLHRIIAEAVAKAADIELTDNLATSFKVRIERQDRSTYFVDVAEITIELDHRLDGRQEAQEPGQATDQAHQLQLA